MYFIYLEEVSSLPFALLLNSDRRHPMCSVSTLTNTPPHQHPTVNTPPSTPHHQHPTTSLHQSHRYLFFHNSEHLWNTCLPFWHNSRTGTSTCSFHSLVFVIITDNFTNKPAAFHIMDSIILLWYYIGTVARSAPNHSLSVTVDDQCIPGDNFSRPAQFQSMHRGCSVWNQAIVHIREEVIRLEVFRPNKSRVNHYSKH